MSVDGLVFSRDGRTVFAAGGGLTALDVATGRVLWADPDPFASCVDLLPHPDGDRLVAVGPCGVVTLHDAATGAMLWRRPQPSNSLNTVAVSCDGRSILVGGFRPFGAILEADGATRATLPLERGMYLNGASFAPDDATVVTVDSEGGVALWSVADGGEAPRRGRVRRRGPAFDLAEANLQAQRRLALHARRAGRSRGARHLRAAGPRSPSPRRFDGGDRPREVDLATFGRRTASSASSLAVAGDDAAVATVRPREARWWSLTEGRALLTLPLGAYVTALRPLPEADRYALMQPGERRHPVLDVAARTLDDAPRDLRRRPPEVVGPRGDRVAPPGAHAHQRAGREPHAEGERVRARVHPRRPLRGVLRTERGDGVGPGRALVAATAKVRSAIGLAMSPLGDEVAVLERAACTASASPMAPSGPWKASGAPGDGRDLRARRRASR